MKTFRRVISTLLILIVLVLGAGAYMHWRAMQVPTWYRPLKFLENQEVAANSMTQKLFGTYSAAQDAQAAEHRALVASTIPSTMPAAPIVVEVTEDEFNAFFNTWDVRWHWKEKISDFVQNPALIIEGHELILAGTLNGWDSVMSVHFEPRLVDGKLDLRIKSVMAGNLSLPQGTLLHYLDKWVSDAEKSLPSLRKEAEVDPRGWANSEAVGVAMAELLLHIVRNELAEPVLFIPEFQSHRNLPVMVSGVEVSNNTLKLTLVPMNAAQREALQTRLRQDQSPQASIEK